MGGNGKIWVGHLILYKASKNPSNASVVSGITRVMLSTNISLVVDIGPRNTFVDPLWPASRKPFKHLRSFKERALVAPAAFSRRRQQLKISSS